MSRESALAAVSERISRYESTADPAVVLDSAAMAEVGAVGRYEYDSSGEPDLPVCTAAGWLTWYRYIALARDDDPRAAQAAADSLAYLRPVCAHDSIAVPEPAVASLPDQGSVMSMPPHFLRPCIRLSAAIEAGDEPEVDRIVDLFWPVLRRDGSGDRALAPVRHLLALAVMRRGRPGDHGIVITELNRAGADPRLRRRSFRLLGLAHLLREETSGEPDDLDEAIRLLRTALLQMPPGDETENQLVEALRNRFDRTGDLADLNEAVRRQRVVTRFSAQAERDGQLSRLSTLLLTRFRQTGDSASIEEAAQLGRESVVSLGGELALLNSLVLRFESDGRTSDLDEAIATGRRLMTRTDAGSEDRETAVTGLSGALLHRHRARIYYHGTDADLGDLREAIELLRGHVPPTDLTLYQLGGALDELGRHDRDVAAIDEAIEVTARAAESALGTSREATTVGGQAVAFLHRHDLRGDPADLLLAVELARRAATTRTPTHPRFRLEMAWAWADWSGRAGDWDGAAEGYAYGLALLPGIAPADLLRTDRESRVTGLGAMGSDAAAAALNAGRPELAVEALERTRTILAAQEPVTSCAGPVVIVNVSRFRADALVVDGDELRVLPLPDLRYAELTERVRIFDDAVRTTAPRLADRLAAQAVIQDVLDWLRDTVTGPILDALDLPGEWPRVWWSPTGPLTFLPLHATVLDRVVSSYTPTLGALELARRRLPEVGGGPLLTVAMPSTPGHADLGAAYEESLKVAATRPAASSLTGPQATRENVLTALRRCGWAHFACHAHADPQAPSTSHLILHDEPLTVADLLREQPVAAELAYLSACSTARTSEQMTGEAVHLGSAFQLAGFPHVIATLWPVADEAAARVTERFYAYAAGLDPAAALHFAVRDVREAFPLIPAAWAAHLHTGP